MTTPERLGKITLPQGVRLVLNDRPEEGQSKSLRLGLAAAWGESYLFLNADQPRLTPASLTPLFELAEENPRSIIYPTANGNPCAPALFPARFRAQLLATTGDVGGRAVRIANPDSCLTFAAQNPDDFADIDSPQDYRRIKK